MPGGVDLHTHTTASDGSYTPRELVAEAARARGWRRIILVTSPQHSRRVKLVWTRESSGSVEGLVALVKEDEFPGDGWWWKRRQAEAVLHEYLGIAAIYLGVSKYFN